MERSLVFEASSLPISTDQSLSMFLAVDYLPDAEDSSLLLMLQITMLV